MRGQVLGVDVTTGEGVVSGDDGRRYTFTQGDWAAARQPAVGLPVDFVTDGARALKLFPLPAPAGLVAATTAVTDRNKLVAALLAFFLGTLGIHRFYLGRNGSGVLMLVLSLTVVGLIVTMPWALVDMVRYLVMPDEEFAQRYGRA